MPQELTRQTRRSGGNYAKDINSPTNLSWLLLPASRKSICVRMMAFPTIHSALRTWLARITQELQTLLKRQLPSLPDPFCTAITFGLCVAQNNTRKQLPHLKGWSRLAPMTL